MFKKTFLFVLISLFLLPSYKAFSQTLAYVTVETSNVINVINVDADPPELLNGEDGREDRRITVNECSNYPEPTNYVVNGYWGHRGLTDIVVSNDGEKLYVICSGIFIYGWQYNPFTASLLNSSPPAMGSDPILPVGEPEMGRVFVIDIASGEVEEEISENIGDYPRELALHPTNGKLYVANYNIPVNFSFLHYNPSRTDSHSSMFANVYGGYRSTGNINNLDRMRDIDGTDSEELDRLVVPDQSGNPFNFIQAFDDDGNFLSIIDTDTIDGDINTDVSVERFEFADSRELTFTLVGLGTFGRFQFERDQLVGPKELAFSRDGRYLFVGFYDYHPYLDHTRTYSARRSGSVFGEFGTLDNRREINNSKIATYDISADDGIPELLTLDSETTVPTVQGGTQTITVRSTVRRIGALEIHDMILRPPTQLRAPISGELQSQSSIQNNCDLSGSFSGGTLAVDCERFKEDVIAQEALYISTDSTRLSFGGGFIQVNSGGQVPHDFRIAIVRKANQEEDGDFIGFELLDTGSDLYNICTESCSPNNNHPGHVSRFYADLIDGLRVSVHSHGMAFDPDGRLYLASVGNRGRQAGSYLPFAPGRGENILIPAVPFNNISDFRDVARYHDPAPMRYNIGQIFQKEIAIPDRGESFGEKLLITLGEQPAIGNTRARRAPAVVIRDIESGTPIGSTITLTESVTSEHAIAEEVNIVLGYDVEGNCGDGIDNNGRDGIDCDDPDCAATPRCQAAPAETCSDGADNDLDGLVDCEDSDCAAVCQIQPNESICNDEIDNDFDGRTDCEDIDCSNRRRCQTEICDDGLDNDTDTLIDCNDFKCANDPVCRTAPPEDVCVGRPNGAPAGDDMICCSGRARPWTECPPPPITPPTMPPSQSDDDGGGCTLIGSATVAEATTNLLLPMMVFGLAFGLRRIRKVRKRK